MKSKIIQLDVEIKNQKSMHSWRWSLWNKWHDYLLLWRILDMKSWKWNLLDQLGWKLRFQKNNLEISHMIRKSTKANEGKNLILNIMQKFQNMVELKAKVLIKNSNFKSFSLSLYINFKCPLLLNSILLPHKLPKVMIMNRVSLKKKREWSQRIRMKINSI